LGQQQLLLIVLGVIVVGVAVAFAIGLFRGNAIQTKRDLLLSEAGNIATIALSYYKKPTEFGGGGNSFTRWQIPKKMLQTDAGTYEADVTSNQVIITGTGTEAVTGSDYIKVQTIVADSGYYSVIIN
jgi:hypothetical protein